MAPPAIPPRKPVPSPAASSETGLRPGWEKDLTERFRQHISTKRMQKLSQRRVTEPTQSSTSNPTQRTPRQAAYLDQLPLLRHGSGTQPARSASSPDDFSLGAPNSNPTLSNIPIMPAPPVLRPHKRFRTEIHMLSETPCRWENPGLLDEALRLIPFERLCREAQNEANFFAASGKSVGKRPAWTYQDCLIRALMHWFPQEFFQYVNSPKCGVCRGNTMPVDDGTGTAVLQVAPLPEEIALSANKVELYRCPREGCGAATRFARYTDAFVLMREGFRRGRVGEHINTFGMLCRALGSRVRWVWTLWNNEDHSWVEVYSEHRKRWIHVDPIERKWDNPTMYTQGWGYKIRYCIAFSTDGATDVTSRYCRDMIKHAGSRSKCTEPNLLYILDEICRLRRRNMDKDAKFKLEGEDSAESRELKHYYVSALVSEVVKIKPTAPRTEAQRVLDEVERRKLEDRRIEAIRRREQGEGRTGPQRMAPPPPPPPPQR